MASLTRLAALVPSGLLLPSSQKFASTMVNLIWASCDKELGPFTQPPMNAGRKLTGRAFYESIGSPKMILAPMVDQSEFVCCFHVNACTLKLNSSC